MTNNKAWPTEIRVSNDKRTLTIGFDNGERHELSAEFLRVMSPSAEVQGHTPSQKQTVPGKRDIGIMKVEPVGNSQALCIAGRDLQRLPRDIASRAAGVGQFRQQRDD